MPQPLAIDGSAVSFDCYVPEYLPGAPYKWRIPGDGVILLDAETVTVAFTVVPDLAIGD